MGGYYEISGIPQNIQKYMNSDKYNITELPKISLSFLLDSNGIVDLVQATATFTEWITEEKTVKKPKKSEDENENENESENADKSESEKESDTSEKDKETEKDTSEKNEEESEKEEKEMVSRKRTHRVELNAQRGRPFDV